MLPYLSKRIGLMFLTFFVTIFLIFMFIKLMPDNHIPNLGQEDIAYQKLKEREGWARFRAPKMDGAKPTADTTEHRKVIS